MTLEPHGMRAIITRKVGEPSRRRRVLIDASQRASISTQEEEGAIIKVASFLQEVRADLRADWAKGCQPAPPRWASRRKQPGSHKSWREKGVGGTPSPGVLTAAASLASEEGTVWRQIGSFI